jgi:hypothetical protein
MLGATHYHTASCGPAGGTPPNALPMFHRTQAHQPAIFVHISRTLLLQYIHYVRNFKKTDGIKFSKGSSTNNT